MKLIPLSLILAACLSSPLWAALVIKVEANCYTVMHSAPDLLSKDRKIFSEPETGDNRKFRLKGYVTGDYSKKLRDAFHVEKKTGTVKNNMDLTDVRITKAYAVKISSVKDPDGYQGHLAYIMLTDKAGSFFRFRIIEQRLKPDTPDEIHKQIHQYSEKQGFEHTNHEPCTHCGHIKATGVRGTLHHQQQMKELAPPEYWSVTTRWMTVPFEVNNWNIPDEKLSVFDNFSYSCKIVDESE